MEAVTEAGAMVEVVMEEAAMVAAEREAAATVVAMEAVAMEAAARAKVAAARAAGGMVTGPRLSAAYALLGRHPPHCAAEALSRIHEAATTLGRLGLLSHKGSHKRRKPIP